MDLFSATHIQRVLQALLGLPTPEYHHHPLICDNNGKRLAKRDDAESLRSIRERGITADELRARLFTDTSRARKPADLLENESLNNITA
jgi:glutamyl-Q tRNA(Asp) synthetase